MAERHESEATADTDSERTSANTSTLSRVTSLVGLSSRAACDKANPNAEKGEREM